MTVKGKYRRLYIGALVCFAVINVLAIFIVFKKYNSDNKTSQTISSTKYRFSKLKEKIESIRDSVQSSRDSLSLAIFKSIIQEEVALDSILVSDNFQPKSIELLNQKIYELSSKSNELEAEFKSDSDG